MGALAIILPILAALLGSGLTYFGNKRQQKDAFDQNVDMWNLQNQYNSPASQIERMQEAGLSPNLMYTQGNVGNAGNMPQLGVSNADISFGKPDVLPYLELQMKRDLTDAQVNKLEADAEAIRGYKREFTESQTSLNWTKDIYWQNASNLKGIDLSIKQLIENATLHPAGHWQVDDSSFSSQRAIEEMKILKERVNLIISSTANQSEQARYNAVRSFFAETRKELGISPDDPWYLRFIADMLNKTGLSKYITQIIGK